MLTNVASCFLVPGSFNYLPEGAFIYFNRTDVQDAIHAPHIEWEECSSENVFVNGEDTSLPSAVTVLPGVIERTQNVIIGHGALDMILYVFLEKPCPLFFSLRPPPPFTAPLLRYKSSMGGGGGQGIVTTNMQP